MCTCAAPASRSSGGARAHRRRTVTQSRRVRSRSLDCTSTPSSPSPHARRSAWSVSSHAHHLPQRCHCSARCMRPFALLSLCCHSLGVSLLLLHCASVWLFDLLGALAGLLPDPSTELAV